LVSSPSGHGVEVLGDVALPPAPAHGAQHKPNSTAAARVSQAVAGLGARINWLDEVARPPPPATTRNNMKQIIAHVLRCRCCPRHWHSQYGPLVQVTQVVEAVVAVPLNSKPGAQSATASSQRSMRVMTEISQVVSRCRSHGWVCHVSLLVRCASVLLVACSKNSSAVLQ